MKTVTFANILSGAMLKLNGVVDNRDLIIIIMMLRRENIFLEDEELHLKRLTSNGYQSWGIYELQNKSDPKYGEKRLALEAKQGETIEYFMTNRFDLKEFTLRKLFPRIEKHIVDDNYSSVIVKTMKELINDGFMVEYYWDYDYTNLKIIDVFPKGKGYLFIKDNPYLIASLKEIIETQGLSSDLLNDFILENYPVNISNFSISEYHNYCTQKKYLQEVQLKRERENKIKFGEELPF